MNYYSKTIKLQGFNPTGKKGSVFYPFVHLLSVTFLSESQISLNWVTFPRNYHFEGIWKNFKDGAFVVATVTNFLSSKLIGSTQKTLRYIIIVSKLILIKFQIFKFPKLGPKEHSSCQFLAKLEKKNKKRLQKFGPSKSINQRMM